MSIKLLDNEAFYGYRVRRTVNGKLYQEYFSLKKDGRRMGPKLKKQVERKAIARDEELMREQVRIKKQLKAQRCFNIDGSVKGISHIYKVEKSGMITPIFQVGIASELEKKIFCTSFSINAHGKKNAWIRAVNVYAKHKRINKNTKLYKRLVNSLPKQNKAK
ncbi:hypothetical protein [uncultured Oceanicoccus sp.]|uniref:hypothetical protein n=1 Tax=uncultured Oceanicoccus sp. TaxID=1706381 RepID=UPI0030DC97EC